MPRPLFIALAVFAASCGAGGAGPISDAAILPASQAKSLTSQCSRGVPAKGEGTWQPSWADITAMESALRVALKAEPRAPERKGLRAPEGWRRQYVGVVRGGRRFIYGNYLPPDDWMGDRWRSQAVIVCDGGAAFFGAEYDVAGRRISHLAFNGGF